MKLAIVGTTINLSDNEERDMRQLIALTLKHYDVNETLVISGGAKGVDTLGIEIAKGLGFQTKEYYPNNVGWEFYRKRNLEMVKDCDQMICFSVPVHKIKCYHHTTWKNETEEEYKKRTNHEKTAGCWTGNKMVELQKPYQLIVIPKSGSN